MELFYPARRASVSEKEPFGQSLTSTLLLKWSRIRADAIPAARQTRFTAQEEAEAAKLEKGMITNVAAATIPRIAWNARE